MTREINSKIFAVSMAIQEINEQKYTFLQDNLNSTITMMKS